MRISKVFLALVAFASLALASPRAASAFDCDRLVDDEAGAFTGNDLARIERAAEKLSETGADVRVRTVDLSRIAARGGPGTLDSHMASIEATCTSWRAADGGRKNNLIALVVSYGDMRDLGLYYGDVWGPKLDAAWGPLLAQEMRPALRDGRNGDAFVTALEGVARLIGPSRPVPPVENPSAGTVSPPKTPTDLTGLWYVLGGLLVIGIGVGVYFAWRSRKREKEARQDARLTAQQAKAKCVALVTGDDPFLMPNSTLSRASASVAEEDLAPLRKMLNAAEARKLAVVADYGKREGLDSDPEREDLTVDQYLRIAQSYEDIEATFDAAAAEARQIEQDIEALERSVAEVPAKIVEAKNAIDVAEAASEKISASGYRTPDADALVEKADRAFAEAVEAKAAKRPKAAIEAATRTVTYAKQAGVSAEALPGRRQAILDRVAALRTRISGADGKIDEAVEVFTQISKNYAEVTWRTVEGNGSEAENCVLRADEQVRKALIVDDSGKELEGFATMEKQEWTQAETALAQAEAELARANSLLRSIYALKENLEIAKRDAKPEIAAARADITSARDFITKHDDDIREQLESDLDAAAVRVDEAEAELAKGQPDYLFVLKSAKLANSRADDILVTARGEHEAAERQRAKAASTLRDAQAAVSRAGEYVEDHQGDMSYEVGTALTAAKRELAQAEAAATPTDRIRESEETERAANAVLKSAQGIVERKRQEREEAERRERERLAELRRQREAEERRQRERIESLERERQAAERRAQEARDEAAREERRTRERASAPSISFPSPVSVPRPAPTPYSPPASKPSGGGGGSLGGIGRSRGGGGSLGGW